ncbi:MAG: ribbon-helix-helix domain-containing protein [Desulfovibrionales bacterium]|nr:ribbon-helix-helix domain-containing protein [Desulfovibrionales bacterium]
MCFIYASTPPEEYQQQTRSIRINGAVTSIRLEMRFWRILEQVAARERTTLGLFLSALHAEATTINGDIGNFASLLRVVCTTSLEPSLATHAASA